MPSTAFAKWRAVGIARLDALEAVHAKATGTGPGRRWGTEQLNQSLFIMLVAQFQTFCSALHDEAVDVVGIHIAHANLYPAVLLRTLLVRGRKLDTQTPRVSTLASDFGRFDIALVEDLKTEGPPGTGRALEALDTLVDFRNAIVHGNEVEIAALMATGRVRATKQSYRYYRRRVESLAGTMDRVVADRLAGALQVPPPW